MKGNAENNQTEKEIFEYGKPISELFACYNGTMLGFFLVGSFGSYLAGRYPILRQRIHEFLDELNIKYQLPSDHSEFAGRHAEITTDITKEVFKTSNSVFDYFMIGSLAMYTAIEKANGGDFAETFRTETLSYMERRNLSPQSLSKFEKSVALEKDGRILADKLHSGSLAFLNDALKKLQTEEDTAFVAMPFSAKFRKNFVKLYQPLLERLGYRSLRAWGGLASEDYQVLLGTLMSKCGAVLAELTTLNKNVLHEIGMAEGRDQWLFLIAEKDKVKPPSNIADLAIFQYEREGKDWEQKAIDELAMMISLGKLGAEMSEKNEF